MQTQNNRETDYDISYFVGLDLGQSSDYTCLVVNEKRKPRPINVKAGGGRITSNGTVSETASSSTPKNSTGQSPHETVIKIKPNTLYHCRHLERFELGTSYTAITDRVCRLFCKPPLMNQTLVVDRTGVGAAVCDFLQKGFNTSYPCMNNCVPGIRGSYVKESNELPPYLGGKPNNKNRNDGIYCTICNDTGFMRPRGTIRNVTITSGTGYSNDGSDFRVSKKELVSLLQVLLQSNRLLIGKHIKNSALLIKELENFKVKITAGSNETFESWREKDHDDLVLAEAVSLWVAEKGSRELWVK